ncbi:venom peptide SjAPI-2 [Vespula maculifrons]|uniref:Venom peptide SjAPI-2 n=1 Tax=Vespula maculifrons TaxID=7453 RepID=A0ABD2B8P0_VESMC
MFRTSTIIFVLALCIESIVCTSTCGPNAVFSDCSTSCPITCENYQNPPKFCTDICIKGCSCVNGTVLKNQKECVLPCQC